MSRKKKKQNQPINFSPEKEALERFRKLLPADELGLLLEELEKPLYPGIRLNPLKSKPEALIKTLVERYQWKIEPVPFCDEGYWIVESATPISQPIEHRLGSYYIQDPASMLPVSLFEFDNVSKPLILDMAASPGGKTTHLISRSKDQGLVVANDASQSRITALKLVLQTWGGMNIAVTRFPGEKWGSWFPETFDRVLLDAPCSMQNLRSTEARSMRPITEKERQRLASRQFSLLSSALAAVKTGGQIVYATCTLNPEENEGVLDNLLREYPDSVRIDCVDDILEGNAPALSEFEDQTYHPDISKAARLWPHRMRTSGFFTARITKMQSIPVTPRDFPERAFSKTKLKAMKHLEKVTFFHLIEDRYGFDFSNILESQELILMERANQKGNQLFVVPEIWVEYFALLPYQNLGMLVGEEKYGNFEPSHEWLSRFAGDFTNGKFILPDELKTAWLRGEDMHIDTTDQMESGVIAAVFNQGGQLLGKGKILPGRVRNLLPSRLIYQ
ncbi:MAG: NOL1/NOP2/sun family putative RNA methylase [Anaerolineaceae bacterium]|nr:NOL1/NOP2/sun family putative RNA methylase [Anaerolineaceae bacterium]